MSDFTTNSSNHSLRRKVAVPLAVLISVAVAILVLLYILFFRKPYTQPVEYYCNGVEELNGNYLFAAFNEDLLEEYFPDTKDKDELKDLLEKSYEMSHNEIKERFGENFSISYRIQRENRMTDKELEEMEKLLNEAYEDEYDVDDGYTLKVKLIIEGKTTDSEISTLKVWKINDEWCMIFR